MKKIILAYSGGLDTSYCLKKLFKEGNEVHAVNINTGGFTINEIELIKEKAETINVNDKPPQAPVSTYSRPKFPPEISLKPMIG